MSFELIAVKANPRGQKHGDGLPVVTTKKKSKKPSQLLLKFKKLIVSCFQKVLQLDCREKKTNARYEPLFRGNDNSGEALRKFNLIISIFPAEKGVLDALLSNIESRRVTPDDAVNKVGESILKATFKEQFKTEWTFFSREKKEKCFFYFEDRHVKVNSSLEEPIRHLKDKLDKGLEEANEKEAKEQESAEAVGSLLDLSKPAASLTEEAANILLEIRTIVSRPWRAKGSTPDKFLLKETTKGVSPVC